MSNKSISKGKKLAKKELKIITGGLVRCKIYGDYCYYHGPGCQETECQPPIPVDPID